MNANKHNYVGSKIPNYYYCSEKILNFEKEILFEGLWHYVGLMSSFKNENDFITIQIGNKFIVVQKFKNDIKAFQNICTHRFKKIQTKNSGNRPLMCQYHGWSYNENGIPYGIPMKSEFQNLNEASLQKLCLEEYKIDYVGEFIFINISKTAISLKDYLNEDYNLISNISSAIGKRHSVKRYNFKANWKLVIENTLEGYHLSTVHPLTFGKIGINTKSITDFHIKSIHSNMVIKPEKEHNIKQINKLDLLLKNRPYKTEGFFHQLIFPNMLIGSAFGFTFYVGYIMPISEKESEFVFEFYETGLNGNKELNKEISDALSYSTEIFNDNVMMEDIEMVNEIQNCLLQVKDKEGFLNSKELRIAHFQDIYMNFLKDLN
jgi:phenylpropionate dioxygenase-like ring-hydroxylating dioxygenase large terminal subunit